MGKIKAVSIPVQEFKEEIIIGDNYMIEQKIMTKEEYERLLAPKQKGSNNVD